MRRAALLAGLALAALGSASCAVDETDSSRYRPTSTYYVGGSVTNESVLDLVWDSQSPSERASICAEVRLRGPDAAALIVTAEATTFSPAEVARKLREWC